jgi:hypothetical protein
VRFQIEFSGHKNIRALHEKTIEITKESELTTAGDCIIGVNAESGCNDLPPHVKKKLKNSNSIIKFSIKVNEYVYEFTGKGNHDLIINHPTDIVIRKSDFICPRTLAVNCETASNSIPRNMVKLLQNPKTKGIFTIETV